ncbi:MAG: P-loop NTPase fold protein [Scytonema sp. PMC 1070.18]|nr:P-loop NTPase fold protein [Scytonema sp. PMC 1070.18]
MTQNQKHINSHIETYLDYFCGLSHAPGFAVLLKGQWGCGKTWFINRYREKPKTNNQKFLYVSLYGMTSFSEIEDTFFQQLHPVLSSKGMAITAKIFKGFLKGALKIDLNSDGNDDGRWTLEIPDINLPEYLKDTDKSILIFDDLERCQIDISNLLGYINYFVEHQDLKVIIIANEDEILKHNSSDLAKKYKTIKEKLIGKTFAVSLNFEGALENFITGIKDLDISKVYAGLGYQGKDFTEFQKFCSYIDEVKDLARFESIPGVAQDLLTMMQDDVWKFNKMIYLSNSPEQIYYDVPILKYIEPFAFVKVLLLMNVDHRRTVGWAITKRYKCEDINKQLLEELNWLKSVRDILLNKAHEKKGKNSGYQLELFIQHYLKKAIQNLENKNNSEIDA